MADSLVDEVTDQETRLAESEEADNRRQALGEALSVLNERERRIFEARRLADEPIILEELAAEFGISRERVRQIEVCAFEKVQKVVKNRISKCRRSCRCIRNVMATSGCLYHHTYGERAWSAQEHRRSGDSPDHRREQGDRP